MCLAPQAHAHMQPEITVDGTGRTEGRGVLTIGDDLDLHQNTHRERMRHQNTLSGHFIRCTYKIECIPIHELSHNACPYKYIVIVMTI